MNPADFRETVHATLREGTMPILNSYLEDLMAPGVDTEDKRKALEMIFRTAGIENKEKLDTLPLVQITFVNNRMTVETVEAPVEVLEDLNLMPEIDVGLAPTPSQRRFVAINQDLAGL